MALDADLALTRHLVTEGRLSILRAAKATVLFARASDGVYRKLCLIGFNKNTGGIFAQFTYFRSDPGVVGRVTTAIRADGTSEIDWREGAKVATNMVKYSHPPDGRSHFSQDGSHVTQFRTTGIDLRADVGALFEIHAYYLEPFELLRKSEAIGNRLYLPFVADGGPEGVSVSVEWARLTDIAQLAEPDRARAGPVALLPRKRDGHLFKAALLSPPDNSPLRDGVLLVNVHPLVPPAGITTPALIFMGGWERGASFAPGTPVSFLSFSYPVANIEEMRRLIGTADYTGSHEAGSTSETKARET